MIKTARKLPHEYAGVIFDCDGTLTNSMDAHYVAWHATMSRYGIDFTRERFFSLGGMPTDKIVGLLARDHGIEVDIRQVSKEKEEAFLANLSVVQPFEPAYSIARNLRGKRPIAVASGGFRYAIVAQLKHVGCLDWFDVIVTAEDTERHKPFPDVFLAAADRLGVLPADCLVFEDADLGIEAARAAGMDFIDVRLAPAQFS